MLSSSAYLHVITYGVVFHYPYAKQDGMFQIYAVAKSLPFHGLNCVAADREHQTFPVRGNLVVSGA